ncbi:hypothetical protein ACOSP7_010080 [Xanthoceras sorbifolium]
MDTAQKPTQVDNVFYFQSKRKPSWKRLARMAQDGGHLELTDDKKRGSVDKVEASRLYSPNKKSKSSGDGYSYPAVTHVTSSASSTIGACLDQ